MLRLTVRRLAALVAATCAVALPAAATAQGSGVITNLRWAQRAAHPGENLWANYLATADTTVSFSIRDAHGRVVRDLGDDVPVSAGHHGVDWEGYGQNTRPLPDGMYALVLTAANPDGFARAPIAVDSHPPRARFLTPTLTRRSTLVIALSDNLSGISHAVLGLNGHYVARVGRGATRLTYRPRGGFRPGTYPFTVYVTDNADNHVQANAVYVVAKPKPKHKKKKH